VTVDVAGGTVGGAARFRDELRGYLERHGRGDVRLIGAGRGLTPGWLAAREAAAARRGRRVALNNVGFLAPGGERWTLLVNALHFLAAHETAGLSPALRAQVARQARVVRRAALRSDLLVAPCTAMAERVAAVLPAVAGRLVVRMHPVSAAAPARPPEPSMIFCPVLFAPYKHMPDRIAEWLAAADRALDDQVRLVVTASPAEVPASLAASPRLHLVGRLTVARARDMRERCQAVYYPTGLESFGCPLAEARAVGRPVIARDTPQNREIAGQALCGYTPGDSDSLLHAIQAALTRTVAPDPAPFDPDAYFDWLLGPGS
jgi:glycosyltransferase involved in cell wall biosynthesis